MISTSKEIGSRILGHEYGIRSLMSLYRDGKQRKACKHEDPISTFYKICYNKKSKSTSNFLRRTLWD